MKSSDTHVVFWVDFPLGRNITKGPVELLSWAMMIENKWVGDTGEKSKLSKAYVKIKNL